MTEGNNTPEYARAQPLPGSKKSKLCQQRRIKVQAIQYTQPLKNPDKPSKEMRVPWIRMQGLWLQQAGFVINAPVTVQVMQGCVVLTLET